MRKLFLLLPLIWTCTNGESAPPPPLLAAVPPTYSVDVEKVGVNQTLRGQWSIILRLKLYVGADTSFVKDFSVDYKTGEDIDTKVAKFQDLMQEAIDEYKAEQTIYLHTKTDNAVVTLETNLQG